MPVSAPRPLLSGRKGTKLHRGGSDWTLGNISVLGGWAGTGTGFLEVLGGPVPVGAQEAFGQCPCVH